MTAKELRDAAQRARSRGDYSEARDLISEAMELERESGRYIATPQGVRFESPCGRRYKLGQV